LRKSNFFLVADDFRVEIQKHRNPGKLLCYR
jgi:hypothetical protein